MNRPTYSTAVFRPMSGTMPVSGPRAVVLQYDTPIAGSPIRVLEPDLAGFDFGHFISDVGHTVSHVVSDVGHAVDHAAHDVEHAAGDALKWAGHAIQHPDQAISEAANWIVHAAKDVGNFIGHNIVTIVQLVQIGVSFIPGIGEGLSAVIGTGLALAEGKGIADALIAGALSALPGGPVVQMAASIAAEAITGAIEHKSFADIVGNVVADNIPAGGELAKTVVHAAAGVIGAATTGHSIEQALVSGATSAVGAALGGQIPIPAALSDVVNGAAGKVISGATSVLGKSVVDAAGHVIDDVAHGKRLDQALSNAAAGAAVGLAGRAAAAAGVNIPSGQLTSTLAGAAAQVFQGKPLDMVALGAARANLPGGQDARNAFDAAVALYHAKNVQQAGLDPSKLVPNDPTSQKFFHATRVIVQVGLNATHANPKISADELHRLQLKALQDHIKAGAPAVPRPVHPGAAAATPTHPYGRPAPRAGSRGTTRLAAGQTPRRAPPPPPSYTSAVLHPTSAPELEGLFDDVANAVQNVTSTVQSVASSASSLPIPSAVTSLASSVANAAQSARNVASSLPVAAIPQGAAAATTALHSVTNGPSPARAAPGAAGAVARAVSSAATAVQSPLAKSPAETAVRRAMVAPAAMALRAATLPSASRREANVADTGAAASSSPSHKTSLVLPLALGGAAIAAAGGAAWWVHMNHEHGTGKTRAKRKAGKR